MRRLIQYFRGSDVLALQASFDEVEREIEPQAMLGFRDRTAQSIDRGIDVLNNTLDVKEAARERLLAELAVVEADITELHESLAILSTAARHFATLGKIAADAA